MSAPRLSLEALEARLVPVSWGNPWPAAEQLTLSFAPDGTGGGGQPTNLFQTLNAQFPAGGWQREILRALQTWAVEANINVGVVADGGQNLGVAGRPQGDARFGDLRISARPFTSEVYALAVPFDPLAGTWAGDIRLNSNVAFAGAPNAIDLYTALLQEAGHALGLSNSADPSSVMFETYDGVRAGLGAEDVARIQSLYAARQPDVYEGSSGNGAMASATPLAGVVGQEGAVTWKVPRADLTTAQDVDVYRLTSPILISGMVLRLERTGVSLVTPRVTVYDFAGNAVATATSVDPVGGDLNIRMPLIIPGLHYYVKVEGAGGGVFDVGAYRLRAQTLPWFTGVNDFLPDPTPAAGTPRDDAHSDDTFLTAEALSANSAQAGAGFDYGVTAKIRDAQDVDYYRVQAPNSITGDGALTVMAWGVQNGGLQPRLRVFDQGGNPVTARLLVNENGVFTAQIDVFVPGQQYVVEVESSGTGDYFLGVDFNAAHASLSPWAQRTLTEAAPQETGSLHVYRTGLFHFLLEGQGSAANQVVLTVYNAAGQIVAQLSAAGGSGASVTLTLGPGEYSFAMQGQAIGVGAFSGLDYRLQATRLSDPVGPRPEDPTEDPSAPPPPPPGNPPESWYYAWTSP